MTTAIVPLTGYVSEYNMVHQDECTSANALGYTKAMTARWKFYIKLTAPGYSPHAVSTSHYSLNAVTADPEEAAAIDERLSLLKATKQVIQVNGRLGYARYDDPKNPESLRCGVRCGIPAEELLGDLSTEEPAPVAASELRRPVLPLRGEVLRYGIERRNRGGWKVHIQVQSDRTDLSPEQRLFGLNYYTTSAFDLDVVKRSLHYLKSERTLVDFDPELEYYEWREYRSGRFLGCSPSLVFYPDVLEAVPDSAL